MKTQNIINLLNDSSNEESKFSTRKWYHIYSQTAKVKCNQNNSTKFDTESTKPSLCDYSDAFILVTGDITVTANNDTNVAFKNCAPFSTCETETNDIFIHEANCIYIAMPMCNLVEYSNNYSNTSGGIWQFKKDKVPNNKVVSNTNSSVKTQ